MRLISGVKYGQARAAIPACAEFFRKERREIGFVEDAFFIACGLPGSITVALRYFRKTVNKKSSVR
jgi:hypothetical protein